MFKGQEEEEEEQEGEKEEDAKAKEKKDEGELHGQCLYYLCNYAHFPCCLSGLFLGGYLPFLFGACTKPRSPPFTILYPP